MERAIQPEIPLPDSGAHERVREHPEAIARTGVHRRLLYKWRDQVDPADADGELTLPNSNATSKRMLAVVGRPYTMTDHRQ